MDILVSSADFSLRNEAGRELVFRDGTVSGSLSVLSQNVIIEVRLLVYSIEAIGNIVEPIAKKFRLPVVYLFGSYTRGSATDERVKRYAVV